MANAALMIEWGMPKDGRETKALEVFMNHMQWWTQLKESGKIEDFNTYGLTTGDMTVRSGFMIVSGSNEQLENIRNSEEYRVNFNHIINVVNHTNAIHLETGEAMTSRMQRYGKVLKETLG